MCVYHKYTTRQVQINFWLEKSVSPSVIGKYGGGESFLTTPLMLQFNLCVILSYVFCLILGNNMKRKWSNICIIYTYQRTPPEDANMAGTMTQVKTCLNINVRSKLKAICTLRKTFVHYETANSPPPQGAINIT